MNIFYLDHNPKLAAEYHCDKHVVKMVLESAQLLSTAHRVLDGTETIKLSKSGARLKTWILPDERETVLYKSAHVNHPSAVWCRQLIGNYNWLYELACELCYEYTNRYNKQHASQLLIEEWLALTPDNLKKTTGFTEPTQAMPDYCKVPGDSVAAYRNYYNAEKSLIAVWNHSEIPYWFQPKE